MHKPFALFEPGRLTATPGVLEAVPKSEIFGAIARHLNGDWGDVPEPDVKANYMALRHGLRLVSAYQAVNGTKFFIITEADRSYTSVLLRNEY